MKVESLFNFYLKSLLCVAFIFLITLVCFGYLSKTDAVPVDPMVHILKQPDGSTFYAKRWGDEHSHGWETLDGYTIIFDETLKKWTYAVGGIAGKLESSSKIVLIDNPPLDLLKHFRPKVKPFSMLPSMPVPSSGIVNIPVILVNFSDRLNTYTKSQFRDRLFGTGNKSMKDYYQEVSYGKLMISKGPSGIKGWYTASSIHDFYGADIYVGEPINDYLDKGAAKLVRQAVAAADAAGYNFAPYDNDGDCYVDVVSIIHQGTGQENSKNDKDIYSHQWDLESAKRVGLIKNGEYNTKSVCSKGGNIKVNNYVIQPEKTIIEIAPLTKKKIMSTVGVFAHEFGHALGLPDLYDTNYTSKGIGDWSLMANGSWNYVTKKGDTPAHIDAWSKYFLGWVNPQEVTGTMENELIDPAATAADVYKLGYGDTRTGEYFLVENRQKTGFDAGLPGDGLLLWHIDGNMINIKIDENNVNDDECYPGGPLCADQHYGVALVQNDNAWHLEKNENYGESSDTYGGNNPNHLFTYYSSPNSRFYDGSNSQVTILPDWNEGQIRTATLSTTEFDVSGCLTDSNGGIFGNIIFIDLANTMLEVTSVQGTTSSCGYFWHFGGLEYGKTYQAIPSSQYYAFTPSYIVFNGPYINLDFSGTQITSGGFLNGFVKAGSGVGIPGVVILFSGSGIVPSPQLTDDGSGFYSQYGFQLGTQYTVQPYKPGYTFSPPSITCTYPDCVVNFTGF